MSHTTTIKSVKIQDIDALRAAVEELRQSGVNCELAQNVKPRMFYETQHAECDYVLVLKDCKYDVGFDKQADGSYVPVFDEWGNHVGSEIGAACPMPKTPEDRAQHQIGKLMQNYAKHAAINAAVHQGYVVEGVTTDTAGNIQLVLGGV